MHAVKSEVQYPEVVSADVPPLSNYPRVLAFGLSFQLRSMGCHLIYGNGRLNDTLIFLGRAYLSLSSLSLLSPQAYQLNNLNSINTNSSHRQNSNSAGFISTPSIVRLTVVTSLIPAVRLPRL